MKTLIVVPARYGSTRFPGKPLIEIAGRTMVSRVAAMAARAECVMLNKGPAICEAVALLDRLLGRMEDHVFKKTPTLRALTAW